LNISGHWKESFQETSSFELCCYFKLYYIIFNIFSYCNIEIYFIWANCRNALGRWACSRPKRSMGEDNAPFVSMARRKRTKICFGSRWRNRSADEIMVVCASKVTQLDVLRSTHSSKTKSRQAKITTIKELIFFVFSIKRCKQK
jgi:hypothetical protein